NDYTSEQLRVIAAWKPSDTFAVNAHYMRYRTDLGGFNYIDGRVPVRERTMLLLTDFEKANVDLYGLGWEWDPGASTVVFESNKLKKDRDQLNDVTQFLGLVGTGITVGQTFLEATDQDTHEVRLVSNAPTGGAGFLGGWDYTAGLFYMNSAQTRPVILNLTFPTHRIRQGGGATIGAKEKALYFDLTKRFGDAFELNLGGRFFDQWTRGGNFTDFAFNSTVPPGIPDTVPFNPNFSSFVTLEES